jgi:FtsP/CotA-like multicopper oxidase with cupredoxin domain
VPEEYPATGVWAYNGSVPGPILRARQGDRLRVHVQNDLVEATTVHWHGIRLPNAMDGVPHITQRPIQPGTDFTYEFTLPDAGTFFYHPHQRSYEQVGRGLAGALIVEERESPEVDRDVLWVLGDYRLNADASIRGGFGNYMDASHAGRIGNTVTLNGHLPRTFRVHAGERIRLRLINAAPARVFALEFRGHRPWVIALDGQPVEPHEPPGGVVVLGPAMRADLVLDMTAAPGSRHAVHDGFYQRRAYDFVELEYGKEPPLRTQAGDPPRLPGNPLAEPDLRAAERHRIVFTGGMMGDMRGLRRGMAWAVNGIASGGERHALASPDTPARPFVPRHHAQWRPDPAPRVARHRHARAARARRNRFRRGQPRGLDVPLPCARAPGERDDVLHPRCLRVKEDACESLLGSY